MRLPTDECNDDREILSLEGVTVKYGTVLGVQNLDMSVREGDVIFLLGRNGAGKSSTLNSIAGLAPTTAGRITFKGEDITNLPIEVRARRGLVLAPEGRRLFTGLTVKETLRLAGWRLSRDNLNSQIDELLALFPVLEAKLTIKSGFLSGGEQQQLALARALLLGGDVLLLDEPSLGLDPVNTNKIFSVLAQLKRDRHTMVLAEQNVMRTLELADKGYVLSSGAVALEGPAASLSTEDIEAAYFGVKHASSAPDRAFAHDPTRNEGT